ncbi:D-alanyl-D-alanine endopeptidase [Spongiibacter taiwanensis]|uniref:D-alanyl-D-alanine endopeptidase n=1 Tax=Spongiibacter taiwanensis TaxID=1748242 RepID=UPI002036619C|nr:D-alanyl-D-alanine endopeptidase [Spongiibacter taiwanensis]USA43942.1 D-alanyl-D-alanine endopeptidase [Spongiibacter taiwanensis]
MKNIVSAFLLLVALVGWSAPVLSAEQKFNPANLVLASVSALAVDAKSGEVLLDRNANIVMPIASLTKVMTAMVVLDGKQSLKENIQFSQQDRKAINNYFSRIRVGSEISRGEALRLALMSSENLAAATLGRHYPGGTTAFVAAMNAKARALGMKNTQFVDASGLSHKNVSTASDLALMVAAASNYPEIRKYSTTAVHTANFSKPNYALAYVNTNVLVRYERWDVHVSKTGYLNEAGRCLVMNTKVNGRDVLMVMLDSFGKRSPVGDAGRIKSWLETGKGGSVAGSALAYQKRKTKELLSRQVAASAQ